MMYDVIRRCNVHRTQVLLEEWQYHRLRTEAARRRTSLSGTLRKILDQTLGRKDPKAALKELAGFIRDAPDLGKEHDRYIYREDWREDPRKRVR